jgi:hypothetical protein
LLRQPTGRNGIEPSRRCAPRFTQAGNFEARGPRTSHESDSRFATIENTDSATRRTCPWRWSDRSRGSSPPHPVATVFPFLRLPTQPPLTRGVNTSNPGVGPVFQETTSPRGPGLFVSLPTATGGCFFRLPTPDDDRASQSPSEQELGEKGVVVKQQCRHGHPYTDENTYRRTDGHTECRTCRRERKRQRRADGIDHDSA